MAQHGNGERRRSADDWVDAALEALARGGLAAVAVEPLAQAMGVTKGSFYWHFENRDALVDAALERWAVGDTRKAIADLNRIADPVARLEELITPRQDGNLVAGIDLALGASLGDARVRKWLNRHNDLWLKFARRAYRQMGYRGRDASHMAILAYTTYLGLVSLTVADAQAVASKGRQHSYAGFLRTLLTAAPK